VGNLSDVFPLFVEKVVGKEKGMLLSELTRLGDKIDIQLIQQLEMQERGELTGTIRTYKSSVFDYISDTEMEISMPTENGRMVLFQIGLRCKLLFYTKKGLYTCNATVQKRYKKENFFVLAMQQTSKLIKFQRREFFRIDCMIKIRYVPITPEVAALNSTEDLFMEIQKEEYIDKYRDAVTLDLSGGGMRFSSDESLPVDSFVVTKIRLSGEHMDQLNYLATKIVASTQMDNGSGKYINRGQFLFKSLRDREDIVRYVFDEERRIRSRVNH
jgi:c-di-GMP-binding flagellar brake protein YcgR